MSSDEWKLEDDMCRCCHSEGTYKGLAEGCNFGNEEEIYADMLKFTLDINLTPVQGPLCSSTYTICDACIQKLYEATSFKKQVLLCEDRFKDMYTRNFIKVAVDIPIKKEIPEDERGDLQDVPFNDDLSDDNFHMEDNKDDFKDNMLIETVEVKKTLKSAPKKMKTKRKPKKPPKKSKNSKNDEETVSEKNGEGDETVSQPTFHLQKTDYRKEGNVYGCSRCDKRFKAHRSLEDHVRSKHYNIFKYFCPFCTKGFMSPTPLIVHKLEEHKVDERFKCNACKSTFNSKVQLKKHKDIFHMLGEKHRCNFCDYETLSIEGLYRHKYKHKTVKNHHCSYCKKSFLRRTTLVFHERIHTGDKRKACMVCGQTFVQKASLNYHMMKYHPEVNF